jgi:serine/threonine protein phosphatase PrpC
VSERDLTADTEFIICACDGIWDCLKSEEAVELIRGKLGTEQNLTEINENMLDAILADSVEGSGGIGCDNMTSIIIQIKK